MDEKAKIEMKEITQKEIENAEIVKIDLPLYRCAESISDFENGIKVDLFKCNLQELTFEKMFILFEKYNPAVENLNCQKSQLQNKKNQVLLETDFKKELNESRPTVAMKEAYLKPFIEGIEDLFDDYECTERFYKSKLNIINELIKNRRVELRLEVALQDKEE